MQILRKTSLCALLLLGLCAVQAQDLEDLVSEQVEENPDERVTETYKSDRIINSVSNEMIGKRELDFKVDHHFGDIGGDFGGYRTFYGLDNAADIRISFTYGITDRINLGIGRLKGYGQQRGLIESTLKYALMEQHTKSMPLSITYYGTFVVATNERIDNALSIANYKNFWDRTSAYSQILLSRKFNKRLSISAGVGYSYNALRYSYTQNSNFASILGFRYKLAKRWGLIGDWYHNFSNTGEAPNPIQDPVAIGLEIETGGHVFHVCFMNNRPLSEVQFIPLTTATWGDSQFRWGFKISRIFNL